MKHDVFVCIKILNMSHGFVYVIIPNLSMVEPIVHSHIKYTNICLYYFPISDVMQMKILDTHIKALNMVNKTVTIIQGSAPERAYDNTPFKRLGDTYISYHLECKDVFKFKKEMRVMFKEIQMKHIDFMKQHNNNGNYNYNNESFIPEPIIDMHDVCTKNSLTIVKQELLRVPVIYKRDGDKYNCIMSYEKIDDIIDNNNIINSWYGDRLCLKDSLMYSLIDSSILKKFKVLTNDGYIRWDKFYYDGRNTNNFNVSATIRSCIIHYLVEKVNKEHVDLEEEKAKMSKDEYIAFLEAKLQQATFDL